MSPMHYAALHGHVAVLQALLGAGCDANKPDGVSLVCSLTHDDDDASLAFNSMGNHVA